MKFAFLLLTLSFLRYDLEIKGICRKDLQFYESKNFTCLDNSKTIPLDYVNDDYCDCPDGTDEPGTNACNNGVFCCKNKNHLRKFIPTFKLNDYVCDCCDGSDEAPGTCPITCLDLYNKEMEIHSNKVRIIEKAHTKCHEYVGSSNLSEERFKKLKDEINISFDNYTKHKTDISNKIFASQKLLEEKKEKFLLDNKINRLNEENMFVMNQCHKIFETLDTNKDDILNKNEFKLLRSIINEVEFNSGEEDSSKEKFCNEFTQPNMFATFKEKVAMMSEDYMENHDYSIDEGNYEEQVDSEVPEDSMNENGEKKMSIFPGWNAPFPSENNDAELVEESKQDVTPDNKENSKAVINKLKEISNEHLSDITYNDDILELAQNIENEEKSLKDVKDRLSHLEEDMMDLDTYFKEDFGTDRIFAMFFNECYSFENKYFVCPFTKVIETTNGLNVTIGKYQGWKETFKIMKFDKDSKNIVVNFECHETNQITNFIDHHHKMEFTFGNVANCYKKEKPVLDESKYSDEL